MSNDSVFDYWDFKDYLAKRFSVTGDSRGMRMKFANLIHASPSYVSKILSGKIKLTLEHVPVLNELLQHTEDESEFFMTLVSYTQAGSKKLEMHFKNKLDASLRERHVKAKWMPNKYILPEDVQARYSSRWYYMVIHALTSISAYQTKAAIAQRLNLSPATVTNVLDYLVQVELVDYKNGRYQNSKKRTFQAANSLWSSYAQANIRQLANNKALEPAVGDLQYYSVMALSMNNRDLIRKKIQQLLEDIVPCTQSEKDEEVYGFSLEFFKV